MFPFNCVTYKHRKMNNNLLKRVQDMKGPSDSDIQEREHWTNYSWLKALTVDIPLLLLRLKSFNLQKKNVKTINPDKLKISKYNNNLVSSRCQTSRDKIITIRVYLLLVVCSGIHGWRQPFVDWLKNEIVQRDLQTLPILTI